MTKTFAPHVFRGGYLVAVAVPPAPRPCPQCGTTLNVQATFLSCPKCEHCEEIK